MTFDPRLPIAAMASVVGHVAIAQLLTWLPADEAPPPSAPVEVRVITPPPPATAPEPEPEPEPAKPEPPKPVPPKPAPPKPAERVVTKPVVAEQHDVKPVDTPPTDRPATTSDATDQPVFGVSMESTSQGGRGPSVPVGNTLHPGTPVAPTAGSAAPKPLAPPVAAYEVTKMPLPQGRCAGKYTEDAKAAGVEGVVVLDLTVDERGRARDITVVQRLDHGLTEAAIAAITACSFTPGEKGGVAVPVRVRGFKIRFLMQDAQ